MITNSSLTVSTLTVSQSVNTVYGGTIRGPIALVKTGPGSLTLNYPTSYSGSTTVRDGTLALGVSGVISPDGSVVLDGGTLDVGNTTNTFASLTVTSGSTLNLGSGKLSLSSQTADAGRSAHADGNAWPGLLAVPALLTAAQLDSIRYEGRHVMQSAAGYIVPWRGTFIMAF
jgi:autotransporter-associated beta strand protein